MWRRFERYEQLRKSINGRDTRDARCAMFPDSIQGRLFGGWRAIKSARLSKASAGRRPLEIELMSLVGPNMESDSIFDFEWISSLVDRAKASQDRNRRLPPVDETAQWATKSRAAT